MTGVNIAVFVLILIVLIILHELGHMIVAKMSGMRVERFSVFFGRPLWSFRRGETEYGIGWLPLGGYVKITGMAREELFEREVITVPVDDDRAASVLRAEAAADTPFTTDPGPHPQGWVRDHGEAPDGQVRLVREVPMAPEIAERAYCNATTPRKVATILAGPLANVVVAIIAFAISFWVGTPVFESVSTLRSVAADTPAASAGLQRDDRLTKVNDVVVSEDPAAFEASFTAARDEIRRNAGKPIDVTFVRDGRTQTVTTPPLTSDPADPGVGRLGVTFDQARTGTERDGLVAGIGNAFRFTGFLTKEQVLALGKLFTSSEVREQVSGPIGIGATYNEFAAEGFGTIMRFVGIISLILAIMNLIPLLPLDGGHIVFALAERLRGRNLSIAVYQRASIIGIGLVMILAIYAFNNDIGRLTGEGFNP